MHDPVNAPAHYTTLDPQPIDVIEAWRLDYHLGNAIKYIARAGKKDPMRHAEDLEKAVWYIRRRIDAVKAEKRETGDAGK